MKKHVAIVVCILGITLLSIRSFFSSGFFPMHDDVQVARVIEMGRALGNGQFPVRLVGNLGYGYGYPIFNFYGPLPYYIGGFLNIIGVDALVATKIMIGLGILLGSISIYLLSFSLYGIYGGLLSTVLFTYFPYRAVQLYVRGAIGEIWAVSLLPFVLWSILMLLRRTHRMFLWIMLVLSLSAVILSHTVFGYITVASILGFSVFFAFITFLKNKHVEPTAIACIGACVLALGLTAFFWMPAILEMNYTNVGKVIGKSADYKDHYICLPQLWDSLWGFGGSAPGCLDGMSFKLGKIHILVGLSAFLLWIFSKEKNTLTHKITGGLFGLTALVIICTLSISEPVWAVLPFSAYIQYPWRFLGPIGIFLTVASGFLLYRLKGIKAAFVLFGIVSLVLLINLKLFAPQYLYTKTSSEYGSKEELRFRASKVSDEYLPKELKIPKNVSEIPNERVAGNHKVRVTKLWETEVGGSYKIEADIPTELKLNMAYYPGWHFFVNAKEMKLKVVDGQPYMILSAEPISFEMRFTDTPVRSVGNLISWVSVVVLSIIALYGKKIVSYYRHTCI